MASEPRSRPDAPMSLPASRREASGPCGGLSKVPPPPAAAPLGDRAERRRFLLEVLEGTQLGLRFRSEHERCALGSHPSNDLVLDDPTVSRFHLELVASDVGVRLRDLGSRNGTLVDGVRVFDALLHEGCRVRVGGVLLGFSTAPDDVQIALSRKTHFGELLGESEAMRGVFELLARCAATDSTILIEGETGTGKERAAEAIHLKDPLIFQRNYDTF